MKKPVNLIVLIFCLILVVSLSGCAPLFALPGQIIGGTFKLLGQILQVASRMPKPPPGVF